MKALAMRIPTRASFVVAAALLVAAVTSDLCAQNQKQQRETLQAKGTIKAMAAGGLIQMVTEDGEEWVIKIDARPDSLWYYAEAEPNWLKSGMLVRFSGRFNKQGQAEGAVRSLAVVTLSQDVRPGVKIDASLNAGANLFSKEKPQDPTAPKPPQSVAADVVGKLTGIKDGDFSVAAPGATLRGTLDEKAIVSVEMKTLQMAKIGDSIEVNGWYPPGMKGRAIASRVTVRAKEPLKGRVKPPPRTKPQAAPADDPLNGPK